MTNIVLTTLLMVCSALAAAAFPSLASPASATSYTLTESDPVRPLALSPDGTRLFACNIPDGRIEVFDLTAAEPVHVQSVRVGMEPVAIAAHSNSEVWVVNQMSDSVSVVECTPTCRVERTLLVGDEPRDIVFAGPDGNTAFITAAHRGQHFPHPPRLFSHDEGRADIWVFDVTDLGDALGGAPTTVLSFFGDTTRPLAASQDGSAVFAAVFRSGNQTTIVPGDVADPFTPNLICPGGSEAGPCEVVAGSSGLFAPGGHPAPNESADMAPAPQTSLIVRNNRISNAFEDELGRDWSPLIPFQLPDCDVAHIDASADPPVFSNDCIAGVGTVNFAMAVSPTNGNLYVANTEARNEVRFEPRVRGRIHQTRISIVSPDYDVTHHHLNPHIDYDDPSPPASVRDLSLSTPVALTVSDDGRFLYLAAFGSQKIARIPVDRLESDDFEANDATTTGLAGGGPAAVVLDDARRRIYTLTRFDNTIRAIDAETMSEVWASALFNPEPTSIRAGRRFLYDATYTSGNGESACASCHVFGHLDGLAWDLGNPDGVVQPNPIGQVVANGQPGIPFHPMKGPFLTQTLRGMSRSGPMHWRGDRFSPEDPNDEFGAFKTFNGAFVSLLGRAQPLSDEEMNAFAEFALELTPGPNPTRPLDGTLTPDQQTGRENYFEFDPPEGKGSCVSCHDLDVDAGRFGTNLLAESTVQSIKVPHLRMLYERVGFPGFAALTECLSDCDPVESIRGFGANSDGTQATSPSVEDPLKIGDFVLAFPSNLTEITGQQVTLVPETSQAALDRGALLVARAARGDCDLVAHQLRENEEHSWLYEPDRHQFTGHRDGTRASIEELLTAPDAGAELTLTCVPPGSGRRAALDRDEDGWRDGDERDLGTSPTDAGDYPGDLPVKLLLAARLTRPAGEQRLTLRTAGLPSAGFDYDPASESVVLTLTREGAPVFQATLDAGDPGWRVRPGLWRWRTRSNSHPSGLKRVKLRIRRGELDVQATSTRAHVTNAGGAAEFTMTLRIGGHSWRSSSPPCVTARSARVVRCR